MTPDATLVRTRVYSVPAAQKATGASRDLLLAAISAGDLAAVRWGNRWLLSGAALAAWLEDLGSSGKGVTTPRKQTTPGT